MLPLDIKNLTLLAKPTDRQISIGLTITLLEMVFVFLLCGSIRAQQVEVTLQDQIIQSRKLRQTIQSDPHRPTYHFVAPEGKAYPFDPNGGIFWNRKYHLGFIYQSLAKGKREHFWGHAVSTDLFHWTLYPDMLTVKEGDIEKGIFSGGAFLSKGGIPHIIYHGQGSATNLIAYSTDEDLRVWKKFEGNPVLRTPEKGDPMEGKYVAWDPECWYDKETDYYYQISGGDKPAFFKSRDMLQWEYLGDFIDQKYKMTYDFEDVSCPDFFTVGNKQVLLFISHNLGAQYYLGNFRNGKYTIDKHGRMNWPGGTFFAPEQLVDNKGRNIIWGWVLERKPERFPDYGWSGVMSLPRVLSLSGDDELNISPPEEVKALRLAGMEEKSISLLANQEKELSVRGNALEIQVEMIGGKTASYGVKVFCSPSGEEETVIKYDPVAKALIIDFIKSSVNGPVKMKPNTMREPQLPGFLEDVSQQSVPFELQDGETLKLDIFLDKSIIEVFANGRLCATQVVYPELPESNGVKLFSGNEAVRFLNLEVWKMAESNAY